MVREIQLSPLERKLKQKTLEMGYPDFEAFCLADRLFGSFLQRYLDNLGQERPRNMDDEAVLFLTGSALRSTKDLYLKNGIQFKQDGFHDNDVLKMLPPEENLKKQYEASVDHKTVDVKELYVSVAKNLCTRMEDVLNPVLAIDSLKSNPTQINFVKQRLGQLAEYAEYARDFGRVISGYDAPERGGPLTASMQNLSNRNLLFKLFQDGDNYEIFSKILQGHAGLHNLRFEGPSFFFNDNTGGEIDNLMNIAEVYFRELHGVTGFAFSSKEKNVVFPGDSKIGFYSEGKSVKKRWKKDQVECVGEMMLERTNNIREMIEEMQHPFCFMGIKLHALGVPFELSERLEDYFASQIVPTLDSTGRRLTKNQTHAHIHKEGVGYVDGIKELVRHTIGKTPNKIKFRYFDDGESRNLANAIGPVEYIVRNHNEGLEVLKQEWTKLQEADAVAEFLQQYKKGAADMYLRENRGVCYIWGIESPHDTVPARASIIETRFATKPIKEKDELASKLDQRQVDIHEVIHAAQVGSVLANRDAAAFFADFVCQEAIRYIQDGRINQEIPYYRVDSIHKAGDSWKDLFLDWLNAESFQFLGRGALAESIRARGMHGALWQRGMQYAAGFEIEKLGKQIKLENCIGSRNVQLIQKLIQENNLDGLRKIRRDIYEHSEETTMLIETAAESFSLLAIKDHIMNFPNKRYSQAQREQYYRDLEGSVLMRGEVGRNFLDVMKVAKTDEERDELLRQRGLVYQQVVLDRNVEPVERRLINLGYPVLNPLSAYRDMEELKHRLAKKRMSVDKVLTQTNYARAYLDEKYSANIPIMQRVINKYGGKEAFKKIHSIETLDELKELAK